MNAKFTKVLYLLLAFILASTTSASNYAASPIIGGVEPSSAYNDLDTAIVITGSGFENGATAQLGSVALTNLEWVSATQLNAVVPWGLEPGVYTLRVANPGGAAADIAAAFTVTTGLNVWNAAPMYGGTIHSVFYNPLDSTTMYASSDGIGLFRSRDGGDTWNYIWSGSSGKLAIDPINPTRMYMRDLRSTDEGETWTQMPQVWGAPYPHPSIAGRVYMINKNTDHFGGVWRSDDFGVNWNASMTGLTDLRVSALAFHPTQPETLYAGTTSGNLFMSIDGGANWTFVDKPLDYINTMAVNPNGSHEVWASNCCFCRPSQTVKSTDPALTSWSPVDHGAGSLTNIYFAPAAWGEVYSQTVFVTGCFNQLARSMDSGATWDGYMPGQGGDNYENLAMHPTNPQIVYTTSQHEGLYRTTDGCQNWEVSNQGLTALSPRHLAIAPGQPQIVYAVTSIGLSRSINGGQTWDQLANYDTGIAIDPQDSNHLYAAAGTTYGWGVAISHDGGLTWPEEVFTPTTEPYADYNAVLAWQLVFQPGQPSTMLSRVTLLRFGNPPASAVAIYRSIDSGQTWTRATLNGQAGLDDSIYDIAFDAQDPTIAYASTDRNGILRSTDSGATWQRVGENQAELNAVKAIAVEPIAPYRVLVQTATGNGIYLSTDHGQTWNPAPGQINGIMVDKFLFTHDPQPVLYAATSSGLFRSLDSSAGWSRAPGALGQTPITALAGETVGDRSVVYVGTNGGQIAQAAAYAQGKGVKAALSATSDLINAGVYRYTQQGTQPEILPTWEQVNQDGFAEGPPNYSASALEAFNGWLYAGTWNETGGQVWRTRDGRAWNRATPSWAVSNALVNDFIVFNGNLYVITSSDAGGEMWRSADGAAWTQVVSGGFGDPANTALEHLAIFQNQLYAAASTGQGVTSLWASPSGDAESWQVVAGAPGGLMQVFDGQLYVGASQNDNAILWRSADLSTWTPVFTNGTGDANTHVSAMAEFGGYLYIGFRNVTTGGEVWRSSNGVDWTPSFKGGLGNPDNQRTYGLVASSKHLYVVFANTVTGAEVWRTAGSNIWSAVGVGGLGDSSNQWADYFDRSTALFGHDLYLGIANNNGAQVLRLNLANHVYLPISQK